MTPRKTFFFTVLALSAAAFLALVGLAVGKISVPFDTVLGALFGTAEPKDSFIVMELRFPRVVAALAVGALLAWAGTLFQGLFRNPLVSPDFIGIEAGASVGAVAAIVFGLPSSLVAVTAFAGAATSALSIYALSWKGHLSGTRLILVGVGMNALLGAVVNFLLVHANVYQAATAYQWMIGSLYSISQAEALFLVTSALVLGLLGLLFIPALRLLQIGDLGARSLGLPIEPVRLAILLIGCALAAAAVSVVGPIGFIALAIPHMARMLAGPLTPGIFLLAGALGALVLLAIDLTGQHVLPFGLPAGLLAAALGGPYFLFLLRRRDAVL